MVGGLTAVSSLCNKILGIMHTKAVPSDKQATHEDVIKTLLEHRPCQPLCLTVTPVSSSVAPAAEFERVSTTGNSRTLVLPAHPARRSSIQIQKTRGKRGDLVVAYVWRNGPCGMAGLRLGDVIVSVNGRRINDVAEVQELLAGKDELIVDVRADAI
eukprot:comp22496_c0_seq1/m.33979 comp22496_c0_seq1/g.33979  ORF comp22496_c0_seq1/g.33979 comp22496_c0_seq1/m.33979 type:complete len:157 (-) comp22496_c0_seq1:631-1101(-)